MIDTKKGTAKLRPITLRNFFQGKSPEGVRLFSEFKRLVDACGKSDVAVRRTIVYWKRKRVFAGAFILSTGLELNIDLLRKAWHPTLLAVFPTTKKVYTHRLRVRRKDEIDDDLRVLVCEAYETVGPGTSS